MQTKELLAALCGKMSVVGFESYDEKALSVLIGPYFDEHEYDAAGNHIFIRRCGRPGAKRLFLDAHYDEVGLMVKGITKEGHLRVCGQGGVDARILPAAEVVVYGRERLPGIVLTKPRELMTGDESSRLTSVTELLIDTGLTKEEAEKAAPIGTPVGFEPVYTELAGGFFAGKGFDNKCSAAAVILAVSQLEMSALECDLYVSLSAREEVGHRAVSTAAFRIRPDAALVLDVTFGYAPEGKKPGDSEMQGGPAVSISAILDKALTDFVVETAEIEKIPVQTVVEATGTGTHADELVYAAGGIPTALIGIPIWFMHTANEILNLEDVEHTARLIAAVIRRRYGRGVDGKE